MLYVFTGTDTVAVRTKAHAFVRTYEKRGATVEVLTTEECSKEQLEDRAGGTSLFGDTTVTLIDTPSESKEAIDVVKALAEPLAQSPNPFVLLEGKLLAADARSFKKHATEYNELPAAKKSAAFNVFSLADALARRDKKSLWILLMRAQAAGLTAEEIIGTLFWQVKSMRLAAQTKSASEAGVKPFVYKKAAQGLKHYKPKEIQQLSEKLIELYHKGHLGMTDIDLSLERFVLRL